jgi:hypothetical protein
VREPFLFRDIINGGSAESVTEHLFCSILFAKLKIFAAKHARDFASLLTGLIFVMSLRISSISFLLLLNSLSNISQALVID